MNMNNEEFNRKMAFIVEQQAQFASDIQQLQRSQAKTEQALAHTAGIVAQTGDVVTRLANVTHAGFTEINEKINALVDAQICTDAQLARTDQKLARTDEKLERTDKQLARTDKQLDLTRQSLRRLIARFDRYLNGRMESSSQT